MQVDWPNWTPRERATLLFIVQEGQVLLIRKKRGLGAGKINGPGGRLEPGETPEEAAIRETREELCIEAYEPELIGELHFQFVDGYSLHCSVFISPRFSGTPTETDEADPIWTSVDAIPYHDMWQDDIHWFPALLERRKFRGYFAFDSDRLLNHRMEWL